MKKMFPAVTIAVFLGLLSGCSFGGPRVVEKGVTPTSYIFAQEPEKLTISDKGRQYSQHVKRMQAMRLNHEAKIAGMEYRAEERQLAAKFGFAQPPLPQARPTVGPAVYYEDDQLPYNVGPAPNFVFGSGLAPGYHYERSWGPSYTWTPPACPPGYRRR